MADTVVNEIPEEGVKAAAVADAPVEPAVVEAVKSVNAKAARTVRKARAATAAAAQPAAEDAAGEALPADATAPRFERMISMTYDFTKLFGGYELAGADKVQAFFADAGEKSQELARKSQANLEEMTDIARANVEAVVEAGRIAAAGAKSLGEELIAKGREGFEEASASVKSLAEATSPAQYFQLQGELAKSAFDRMVAEGSALTERMVKLAGEAAQPLQTRASVVAERMNKLVA